MEQVTLGGNAWIYPRLEFVPVSATFGLQVTFDATVDLHLGPGTMTIGTDTYNLTFNEGDLRVEREDFAEPFEPFASTTLRATRVITATLMSDHTFFADGTGVFSWERFEVRSRDFFAVIISKRMNLRLVNLGQLYNVELFAEDPAGGAEGAPVARFWKRRV
ncbi:MAG: hypothetical protein ACYC9Q_11515 [Bacillota bacterium]